jgi:adenosine kinase
MKILVSGSLAYDRIMDFPGKFTDHILPDKIHVLNVSFMINGLKENFGGTAGNIAYALSLFGERPIILSAAGRDFEPYRHWLAENGLSSEHIRIVEDELTACAYITTDKSDNQITAFNPGAMRFPVTFDFDGLDPADTLAIVSPGGLQDMLSFSGIYKEKGIDYIFDPGQSLPSWSGEEMRKMIDGSLIFICNDYELQLTKEKTSLNEEELLELTGTLIVTHGEYGSMILSRVDGQVEETDIPAVEADPVVDPTGAGDAYRVGLIKGLLLPGKDIVHAARMGALCATYSVEVYGTQNYRFTPDSFNRRFQESFGNEAY